MAKIKLGSIITDAKGKLGGHVVGKTNGTHFIRTKSASSQKVTNRQSLVRKQTLEIQQAYNSLTTAQKLNWTTQGRIYSNYPEFATSQNYTGFGLFQKLNQGRLNTGQSMLLVPNPYSVPTYPLPLIYDVTTTVMLVQSSVYNSDDFVSIYATGKVSKGLSKPYKRLRFIAVVSASQLLAGYDLMPQYLKVFPNLANNDEIFFGIKTTSAISGYSNGILLQANERTVVGGIIPPPYDADALAYFNAIGTLTDTMKTAINNFVVTLKANSLWSLRNVIYPFPQGNENACKFNLKNPLNTDAANRLDFNGTWTYSALGIQGDNSTAFANTFFIPANSLVSTSVSHSAYYQTNVNQQSGYGVKNGSSYLTLYPRWSGVLYSYMFATANDISGANANTQGHWLSNQNGGTTFNVYKNGVDAYGTENGNNQGNFANLTRPVYLGAVNRDGNDGENSSRIFSYWSVGQALTSAQALLYYNAIQTLQTELSRNV